MPIKQLKPDVYFVGTIDWDRTIFEEIIPLPDGTSYNSYLVKGSEKIALVDGVDPKYEDKLIENLFSLGIDQLDYIISNHAEQDHSGAIPKLLKLYPNAKVVTNEKCKQLLISLLEVPENCFQVVGEGDTLDLGGKTLQFIMAPWVHWPETMFSYLVEDKILFSCDLFGSHFATNDLHPRDGARLYLAVKRYYAGIMMPFRKNIQKHMEKIDTLEIEMIAPSHGVIYNKPEIVLNLYREWISDEVQKKITFLYVSMHGTTAIMSKYLTDELSKRGITVDLFNLTVADIGQVAMSLVDSAGVILGSPTVLAGPHPRMVHAAYIANELKPKTKYAAIIGSYGWGGKMIETITGLLKNLKVEMLDNAVIKGYPTKIDYKKLDQLADSFATKMESL